MKLLIDSADIEQIRKCYEYYPIDGVTTNPSILAKCGAAYTVSYVNRIDNMGYNGIQIVKNIHDIFKNNHLQTEVLVASFKNSQ